MAMKNCTNPNAQPYAVLYAGPGAGFSVNSWQPDEKAAIDAAARLVAQNKTGDAIVYKAISVTRMPVPDVEVVKVDA